MFIGILIVLVAAVFLVRYFKNLTTGVVSPEGVQTASDKKEEGYTVSKGDTLWSIAEKELGSGYEWSRIAEENKISNPGKIEEGQKLTISGKVESEKAPVKEEVKVSEPKTVEKTAEGAISGASYIVSHGDTLWDIAVRAYGDGYKWVEIARENNLANPNIIHSGNVLTLPR